MECMVSVIIILYVPDKQIQYEIKNVVQLL